MKKVISLIIGLHCSLFAVAQVAANHSDSALSRWVIDINARSGIFTQDFTTVNSIGNYSDAVNSNTGQLTFKNGTSVGGDIQVGFFFGNKRHFGVGAGVNYSSQMGDITLDNYHLEYSALDFKNNIFRQVVSANNIKENHQITNVNIPVVFKYKNRFSKHWGFTADAGAMINLQMDNSFTTSGTLNYEAIYKFTDGTHARV